VRLELGGRIPVRLYCRTPPAVCSPRYPIGGAHRHEASPRVHAVRPFGLPLHLWLPGWNGTPGLDHLSSVPRSYPRRTSGWGQAVDTAWNYTFGIRRTSSMSLTPSHAPTCRTVLRWCSDVPHRTSTEPTVPVRRRSRRPWPRANHQGHRPDQHKRKSSGWTEGLRNSTRHDGLGSSRATDQKVGGSSPFGRARSSYA
jgi:hypothetical protein